MKGISNTAIVNFFAEKTSDDLKKKFIGVFPSNYVVKFISFHSMMLKTVSSFPFIIMNPDRSDEKGMHLWSFLDLHPKKEIFLFNSFGFEGFKEFIVQDDRNTINKILYGIEKCNKITLIPLRFSMVEYEKIKNKHRLSETSINLLHLINEFGKLHKLKDEVTIHLVVNQLQMIKRDTCGMYQIYFYVILFNPLEDSSVVNKKVNRQQTIEKLLNEILTTDRQDHENRIKQFAEQNEIRRG